MVKELDRSTVLRYQRNHPPGTRILLLHMAEDPHPIPDNIKGSVHHVDDKGQIHCQFDNGHSHTIVPQIDTFRRLTKQEAGEA